MTTRLFLATAMLLGTVSVAGAAGNEPQLTVFVTATPSADVAADSPEQLAGTVDDVKKAITGAGLRGRRKHLVLVDSPAQAQLLVEVRARRSGSPFGLGVAGGVLNRKHFVLFAIKPGATISAERFAAIPRTDARERLEFGPMRPDAPEWLMEALGRGSWKLAGAIVASLVDDFAEAHAATLTGSAVDAQ
jgi:hypothetical protein